MPNEENYLKRERKINSIEKRRIGKLKEKKIIKNQKKTMKIKNLKKKNDPKKLKPKKLTIKLIQRLTNNSISLTKEIVTLKPQETGIFEKKFVDLQVTQSELLEILLKETKWTRFASRFKIKLKEIEGN